MLVIGHEEVLRWHRNIESSSSNSLSQVTIRIILIVITIIKYKDYVNILIITWYMLVVNGRVLLRTRQFDEIAM